MISDRYSLDEYASQAAEFAMQVESLDSLLGNLLRTSEFRFHDLGQLEALGYLAIPLKVHLKNTTSSNIGRTLLELDVELRRCSTYMLSGRMRPLRNFKSVDLISAVQTYSVDIVIAVGHEIYDLLTSRPITFLQLLDWFWSHRLSQTKVRQPHGKDDRGVYWDEIVTMAKRCIERGRPVIVTVDITDEGITRFGFKSQ